MNMVLVYGVWLFVSAVLLVDAGVQYDNVIYVDPDSGIEDSSCWTGGADVPCKTIELALEGAYIVRSTTVSPVVLVQPKCFADSQRSSSDIVSVESSFLSTHDNNDSCPTWQQRNQSSGLCECGEGVHGIVQCNATSNETSVLDCHCMTLNEDGNVLLGKCFFGCFHGTSEKYSDTRYDVPSNVSALNDVMCHRYFRTGQLCSKCIDGYSPLAFSYELRCMNCTGSFVLNWMKFCAATFLPLTCFFIVVVVFKIRATAPQLYGFVAYCQIIASPPIVRNVLAEVSFRPSLSKFVRVGLALVGIWNLDIFRTLLPDMCLNLNSLQLLMLEYVISFYPLLLIVFAYFMIDLYDKGFRVVVWLWKPFLNCFTYVRSDWDIRNSIIHTFATFLFLSYMRIIHISFYVLVPVEVYNVTGKSVGWFLYLNSSVPFFGKEHIPYGIIAVLVTFFFSVLPALLMIFYPMVCFQRLLNRMRLRTQALHTFMDSFQGYYKNRTDSSHDCRHFSGLYLLTRLTFYATYPISFDVYSFAIGTILIITVAMLIVIIKPYKKHVSVYNTVDACMMLTLAMWLASVLAINFAQLKDYHFVVSSYWLSFGIAISPLIYMSLFSVYWIFKKNGFGRVLIWKLRLRFKGYSNLEGQFEELPYRIDNPDLSASFVGSFQHSE